MSGPEEDGAIDEFLQGAVAAYSAGKFGQAEILCKDILKRRPGHIATLQVLAAVAGQSGAPRRGIELLQRAIALQADHADAHIQLAKLLRQDGRVEEAVAALKTAAELQPDNAAAHNDLGLIYLAQSNLVEAADCFGRAIKLQPDLAIAYYNRGLALERQGRYADAMEAFRGAIAATPDFAEAHAKLGNLLLTHGNEFEALECLRRAAAAKPDSAVAFMCEAKILLEQGKAAAAEDPIRRAIERDPQNSDAHSLLGSILRELGRFDDAAVAADLSLALNRWQITAYHELVHVKKLKEADRPLITQMEWMLTEHARADEAKAHLHLALGKAYDDLNQYEQAARHFDEGNRLSYRKDGPYDPARHLATIDRVVQTFTTDFFRLNAALGSDWEIPVLIVGMPRSGTTIVEQILSSHPEFAAGDELAFWSRRASGFRMDASGRIDPAWVSVTARDYQALLTGISGTAKRVSDKRPENFNILGLIHAVFPKARVIHCQRHPVDTCLSIYFQDFARKMDFAFNRSDLADYYGQYQRLMAHWRRVLPSDRFLEIQYEELVTNPEPLIRKMIDFCGLDWDDMCLHSERNKRAVRTASVWQARQPIYQTSVARWRNYEPWLGPLRELLPDSDRMDGMTA